MMRGPENRSLSMSTLIHASRPFHDVRTVESKPKGIMGPKRVYPSIGKSVAAISFRHSCQPL